MILFISFEHSRKVIFPNVPKKKTNNNSSLLKCHQIKFGWNAFEQRVEIFLTFNFVQFFVNDTK